MVDELDVRTLRKPDKHPAIFAAYRALRRGESFVLVNNHDPLHLRDEFESEYPGGFGWDYLESGPSVWRIRLSKLTAAALPRLLCDTNIEVDNADAAGAVWKLQWRERDLDSNIIRLPPDGRIDAHEGPDLDVLIHVLSGSGRLGTELGALRLTTGALVWLPRRSRREFAAGPDGLSYLTVHQRRQALTLTPTTAPRHADRATTA
ncbi:MULTISPECIES: DUF2249 domain-containing protein [unclassified Nocardioides]|uniref:DUF2249 domain-containing protein n=1 Tax=unclassified Nocardioides TaxID=2615069 RepID=UPI000056FA82|nr:MULTISPECIES: DUF2249 domain-containing protein [unclassified Nocardioides]ABL79444.1 conserved hypothetical protein [Nocardioides sp. JS614]